MEKESLYYGYLLQTFIFSMFTYCPQEELIVHAS